MKHIKSIILIITLTFFLFIPKINATNTVDIYFFYSSTCQHCAAEEVALDELQAKYSNLKIHSYEVFHNDRNYDLFQDVASFLDVNVKGVPFTVIGEYHYSGYDENNTKDLLETKIKYYSDNEYTNYVGEYLDGTRTTMPAKPKTENEKKAENFKVELPVIGEVETKDLSLPLIAIVLGALDGFNPCATWILLFLISMLLGMENKRRQWALGITFLTTSAFVYMLFMLAWLSFTSMMGTVNWLRLLISLIAIIGGLTNLKAYYDSRKDDGCTVIDDTRRKKMFDTIKQITREKSFVIAFVGIMILAASVNIIELACSAGFPVVFTGILTANDLSSFQYFMYVLLYVFVFLLDDIIIFVIAMKTLEISGLSTKFGKMAHLVGGILMIIIGLLLAIKPEWLSFHF